MKSGDVSVCATAIPRASTTRTLRVLSQNMWGVPFAGLRRYRRFRTMQKQTANFDVICFQEVFSRPTGPLHRLLSFPIWMVVFCATKGLELLFSTVQWPRDNDKVQEQVHLTESTEPRSHVSLSSASVAETIIDTIYLVYDWFETALAVLEAKTLGLLFW